VACQADDRVIAVKGRSGALGFGDLREEGDGGRAGAAEEDGGGAGAAE
jgi:hypothetical protein